MVNYWPVTENSGTTLANVVAGGTIGVLNGGPTFVTDPVRGQVLQFSANGYVDAGVLPQMTLTNDFTWSFWALNQTDPVTAPNQVILGNRYNGIDAVDFVPREFTKFTPTKFEYHHDGIGENAEYTDLANPSGWINLAVVKQANHFIAFQNGIVQGISVLTVGQNNPQPFYFGGNGFQETWTGQMDDVATWTNAMPTSSIVGIAKGTYTPANAPLTSTSPPRVTKFSDNFSSGLANWTPTNRGLENNGPDGQVPPDASSGQVVLSASSSANLQYWFGNSIESNARYSNSLETSVSVDRVSLTGAGTAYRSSLWILGDDGHYLHFSQNIGELGWSWNARDDGGLGTLNPVGSGNDIPELNGLLDTDPGLHVMKIEIIPTDTLGSVNMFMYLDGSLVAGRGFTNFPADFTIILTGQARTGGDTVSAVFDNLLVQQVPEPTTVSLVFAGLCLAAGSRRRR